MVLPLVCFLLAGAPPEELIANGQHAIESLGTYSFRMYKRERLKGELHPTQEILATIREKPFAVKLEFIKGPGRGRRVLYNSAIRPNEFRVREAGLFSVIGGMWIDVDTRLARRESSHTVTESGLGNLFRRLEKERTRAVPQGGFAVKDEGRNPKGNDCALWISPNKGAGFAAATGAGSSSSNARFRATSTAMRSRALIRPASRTLHIAASTLSTALRRRASVVSGQPST